MRCPFCAESHPTQVVETRESDDGDVIRRRRRCVDCDKRFTTYERIELVMPAVVKKDGSRVEFERAQARELHQSRAAQAACQRPEGRRRNPGHRGRGAGHRRQGDFQRAHR